LLCVGALTHDTIMRFDTLPAGPGKFIPTETLQIAAGMAASAAASASRQGADVSLWASVGDDALASELIAELVEEGVNCAAVRRVAGARSAVATILVDAAGERMILAYYDPRTQADPQELPYPNLSGFDAVLVDVRWSGAAELALRAAKAPGIPGILDADVASRAVLERLLPLASHIVASEPAAAILCGADIPADEAALTLARRTGAFVALTLGGAGTLWLESGTGTGRLHHTPAPRIQPVDTLAAGDVFHGCFAVGLAEGWEMAEVITFASAAAALKCQKFGGRLGAPNRTETLAMMHRELPQ
jgi:sulfofructose kinase